MIPSRRVTRPVRFLRDEPTRPRRSLAASAPGEGAQGIVIRESREKSRKFIGLGDEALPRIPKAVVYDRPSTKDLLHPQFIFSRDAQNHIHEFGQAKYLSNHGANGHVTGVFFREAHRDGFRERHSEIRAR